jgi:hypothetical protein
MVRKDVVWRVLATLGCYIFQTRFTRGEVAEWGDATVCNAVYVGSNPTFASIPSLSASKE